MFLRKIVLALLVANLAYAAYSLGWFSLVTGGDNRQREPERLQRQVNPSAIEIQSIQAQAAPPIEQTCIPPAVGAELWVIYMGPYTTTALRDAKMAALAKLKITSEVVSKPSLKIGLSLGSFNDEASAMQALLQLSEKGVRSANIVLWQAASSASPANTTCN